MQRSKSEWSAVIESTETAHKLLTTQLVYTLNILNHRRLNESRPIMFFRKIFKIIQVFFITILCSILFVNLYFLTARLIFKSDLPKFFGFAQIIVISGSMQPDIDVGDMLIIQEQSTYKVNDIVTFNSNQNLVTHRVIDISDTGIITQGDANNVADDPVPLSEVEGKVVLQIPGVGNLLIFLKTPFGILLMLAVLFLLIEIPYAVERLKQKKK